MKIITQLFKSVLVALTILSSHISLHAQGVFNEVPPDGLQTILTSNDRVVVNFHATWCGACKQMAKNVDPVIKEQFGDKVTFVQVDIDKHKNLQKEYNVSGVPTYIFFDDGNEVDRFAGAIEVKAFTEKIEKFLR